MNSSTLPEFWEYFAQLPKPIRLKAAKAFALWQNNPKHPSLHFKKVNSRQPYLFSVRIDLNYRALATLETENGVETLSWFWIGKHDEYDALVDQHQ